MLNIKLIAIAATLTTIFGFGVTAGYKFQQSKIDDLKSTHAQQLAQIESEAERDLKERQDQINHLQREFAIADTNYQELIKNAQIEINRRDADIRDLRSVPTVKVKRQVCDPRRKDTDRERANATERAELDTETAIRIFRVGDYCDASIRQLTELQNRVNQLIAVCPIEII